MSELLFVAYHFPPLQGSSGIQRTLAFARNLPYFGWRPHILTAHPRAYEQVSQESCSLIPSGTPVYRACALDSQRHLAIGGRYLDLLAVPDRWQSWIVPAIAKGVRLVRRHGLCMVCSTYPIASAHLIGFGVSRLARVPWVADLRDPMLQDGFPSGRLRRWSFGWVERLIFRHAARVVVTTPGCAEFYRERYPLLAPGKLVVIENGFDDELAAEPVVPPTIDRNRPLTLLHSGVLYGQERDPTNFLAALRELRDEGAPGVMPLRVILRAPGGEIAFDQMLARHQMADVVEVRPAIGYREALAEMMQADALLVFQAANCNRQIPAKAYEYLSVRHPILGITDPHGDTGRLLSDMGIESIAALEDRAAIKRMLGEYLPRVRRGDVRLPAATAVEGLSRKARAQEFARVLDEVAHESTSP